jgi:predicted enzyme related to lactoylglutathione lyase
MRLPKSAVPGVGWSAYLADTEGNLFGLMQPDSTAAREPGAAPAAG